MTSPKLLIGASVIELDKSSNVRVFLEAVFNLKRSWKKLPNQTVSVKSNGEVPCAILCLPTDLCCRGIQNAESLSFLDQAMRNDIRRRTHNQSDRHTFKKYNELPNSNWNILARKLFYQSLNAIFGLQIFKTQAFIPNFSKSIVCSLEQEW